MTYRELIKLYREGKLAEQQAQQVEADIEKQEAISEYLYEKETVPELDEILSHPDNSHAEKIPADDTADGPSRQTRTADHAKYPEENFARLINRSIRRAFLKLGAVVLALTLAIVLFIQFALPRIVSSFYYDPGKEVAENTNQISLDLAVYTELMVPGYFGDTVTVDSNGYGDYDIFLHQTMSLNNAFINVSGKIKKNKLLLYDMNLLKRPAGNCFAWFQASADTSKSLTEQEAEEPSPEMQDFLTDEDAGETAGHFLHCAAGTPEQATETLKNLDPNARYVCFVSLDSMMSYEEFMAFLHGKENFASIWCAVCTSDSSDLMFKAENIGFQCDLLSSTSLNWDHEKYPELLLWHSESDHSGLEENMKKEAFMKTHFVSMLRYMAEQTQFLEMMGQNSGELGEAADYVEKHGITVYGFAAVMDQKTALALNELDEVYEIYTEPLH